jgi:hypothetical protein
MYPADRALCHWIPRIITISTHHSIIHLNWIFDAGHLPLPL